MCKLIDEVLCQKLSGQDRADYVKAVKEYNRSGEKIYLNAALYFENGKQNPNGLDLQLLKRVQRAYYKLEKTMTQKQISDASGVGISYLSRIMCGYQAGMNDAVLRDVHNKLKRLKPV